MRSKHVTCWRKRRDRNDLILMNMLITDDMSSSMGTCTLLAHSVFQTEWWSMSAPAMPTMVSRLPKFGSWSKSTTQTSPTTGAASARLPNGFYHHPGPAAVSSTSTGLSTSVRRTGSIRTPTDYSAKWRKDALVPDGGGADNKEAESRGGSVKHSLNGTAHGHHSQQNSLLDSKKSILSPLKESKSQTLSVSKNGPPVSKSKQTGSRPTNGTKQTLNGLSGSKLPSSTSSSLRHPQWSTRSVASTSAPGPDSGSRSGSPLHAALPATRSLSTDNLGSASSSHLAKNDRLRSRSLMVVQRRPSPTPSSTNTARPVGGAKQGGKQSTASCAPPPARVSSQGPGEGLKAPPSALKKPLLPGLGPAPKSNGISYKLSRPSLIKQPRPLRGTHTHGFLREPEVSRGGLGTSVETASSTGSSPASTPEGPESEGPPSQGEMSILGETLEDMSLSSSSSLDQNHTSQEYMDDFDNLGNGDTGVVLLAKNDEDDSGLDQSCAAFCDHRAALDGVTREAELNFVEHSLDWTDVTLRADGQNQLTRLSRSREPEFHEQGGSSLDLSPSDSYCSGGIYMWDEEGLDPLGGAIAHAAMDCSATQHVGSFDSDVNGSDVLTNVDSCDLDDDDLMLDGDFPEDTSLHTDEGGMSHMAEWRRRQLCWGTQEVHDDDDDDSEPECYKLSEDAVKDASGNVILCPQRPAGLHVEELLEDFGAVRSQLEVLRRLLLQEEDTDDDTLTTDTLSPEDADQSQVQTLLQEVQQLKEELRSKDDIISQLTLQLQVVAPPTSRCHCKKTERTEQHTQTSMVERENVALQTPWRERTAVPPVAFLSPPWQYQRSRPYGGRPKPGIPSHLATKITGTSLLPPGRPEPTSMSSKRKLHPPRSAHQGPP
ncbi:serine-rich coiled-coil domain-containing protein 2 isoform X2 [Dunckerocampus dactyliophorus]|uniref:serine-rich coiled-coil domain-containing protein 2 isoform X2 n=1 Tax=Dunckerocampus dactyliophorus TaxID=161453 RepID=UPI0024049C28|nr:serine-rich coiled-coil domain-containing protein 2 isoform X2 [Dunckerocampus dactyliophorus]